MQNILFTNKDTYSKVDVKKISDHTILIITNEQPNISGFCLVTDTDEIYGKYFDRLKLHLFQKNITANNNFQFPFFFCFLFRLSWVHMFVLQLEFQDLVQHI